MKHCIVTPELVHLFRNGGVGTNSYYLAQFLSQNAGEQVTILYTEEVDDLPHWKETFQRECGATFIAINETEEIPSTCVQETDELSLSLRVHRWLSAQSFDVIHFQHYLAAGFCAFQAKRLGEAYQHTHLITIANSPGQWINEAKECYPSGTASEMCLDYMERYCAEHCDTLVSPSRHLLEWMRDNNWRLPPDIRVIPSYLPRPTPIPVPPLNLTHLIFLGRLETRKGIRTFTEGAITFAKWLKQLPADPRFPEHGPRLRLSYVGRNCIVDGEKAGAYLNTALEGTDDLLSWEMHTHFGHHEAVAFAETHADALFVFPSAMDNFPFALNEGAVRGLHQISSNSGGVGEFFNGDGRKFNPTPEGLFQKLREVFENGLPPVQLAFTPEESAARRLEFVRELQTKVTGLRTQPSRKNPRPLISVCVPHYNLGEHLPAALEAISRQTYPNFEVLVVDDASTCEKSREVFAQMQALYEPRGWRFIQKPHNSGVCDTRNRAAKLATGELLAFVDSDNLSFPDMLERLQAGLHKADLDVITCYLYSFNDGESSDKKDLRLLWAFLGGCPEAALFINSLGDANMLVRKSAFQAVGGFRSFRDEASEDLALLLRLAFAGYKLDCSSSILFAYRRRPQSMSRRSNKYWRRMGVLNVFTEGMEPWLKNVFIHKFGNPTSSKDSVHTLAKLQEYREKHLLEREKRRERDRKADERYGTLLEMRSNPYVRLGRFLKIVKRDF